MFFYKHNAYEHAQPEIKDKYELNIIARPGKLLFKLFKVFHGNDK